MHREVIDNDITTILTLVKQLPEEKIQAVRDFVTWLVETHAGKKERINRFSQFAGILSAEEADRIKQAVEEGCEKIDLNAW